MQQFSTPSFSLPFFALAASTLAAFVQKARAVWASVAANFHLASLRPRSIPALVVVFGLVLGAMASAQTAHLNAVETLGSGFSNPAGVAADGSGNVFVAADNITSYTIAFTTSAGGPAPSSGSFDYDSTTNSFTNFLVTWNGATFDLTAEANSPFTQGSGCTGEAPSPVFGFGIMSESLDCGGQTSYVWSGFAGQGIFDFIAGTRVGDDVISAGGIGTGAATAFGSYTIQAATQPQITPPSQTGIASGLAYNGLFTATGGIGTSYTWCVLSGTQCDPSQSLLPKGFSLNQNTGLLSSTGNPLATQGSYPFTVQATDSVGDNSPPQAFTLVIACPVSNVYPYAGPPLSNDQHPTQMEADFFPTDTKGNPLSLDDVAQACNFTGFNWQQTEVVLPTPEPISLCTSGILLPDKNSTPLANLLCSFARTDPTQPLVGYIPYDPPQGGGYTYESYYDDAYPFYWTNTELAESSTTYNLHFSDSPAAPVLDPDLQFEYNFQPTATAKIFATSLVGILPCGEEGHPICGTSGTASSPLSTFAWRSNFNGTFGGVGTAKNPNPVDSGSGTGGVIVISVNGVPTPTVTVTPSPTSITTAQGLTATIAVDGVSSSPTATGSVTLTSGSYNSAATLLSGGSATINIPAGSLVGGSDTLTAVYTPDNASAATFSVSAGLASVTVTGPLITPAVTVTPVSSSITTAQPLAVGIAVGGGSGNPIPNGTVTLSGGGYNSAIASLSGGTATIIIPANSLSIGSDALTADYTPDSNSSSTYNSATGSASVRVQGYPVITWAAPAAITYGTLLNSVQLDATASESGSFTYLPPLGAGLNAGPQMLGVTFNPSDATDYLAVSDSVTLMVNQAPLAVTATSTSKILDAPNPALNSVSYSGFKLSDGPSSLSGTLSCSTIATTSSPVGSYPITCSGLTSSNYTFTYKPGTLKILYASAGGVCDGDLGHTILQPINAGGTSVFKQGSTIPAKFRVCDSKGISVGTPGVVTSFNLVQVIAGTVTSVDESVADTNGDTSFRWDSTNQEWIFNISTKTLKAGYTYVYAITLNDGSVMNFQYGLK